jgi:acetyl-CoA C-acetyltransferase
MYDPIVIVGAARTPMGGFQGDFSDLAAHDLGGAAIKAAVERAGMAPEKVDRSAVRQLPDGGPGPGAGAPGGFKGGLPRSAGAVTCPRCAARACARPCSRTTCCGRQRDVMVAGGMESMTNAPYLLLKGRGGYRIGHDKVFDHMMLDGLEDAYEAGRSMGTFGEDCAAKYSSRAKRAGRLRHRQRAARQDAINSGAFQGRDHPGHGQGPARARCTVAIDEGPGKVKLDKIPTLKPAFKKDGTITAASQLVINDGAAALVMMKESTAAKLGCKPLARIVAHATHAQEPEWFTTAPVGATQKALAKKAGWAVGDVDLWEVNEAFAVVPMALMKDLNVPHDKVNVNGGACALGHPIGASRRAHHGHADARAAGARLKKGLATLCIGGGEATAMASWSDCY